MCSKVHHSEERPRRRGARSARGQSLLEFALALPALLILFLGLIELALILRAQVVLTNANREAARFASRGTPTDDQVAERAVFSFAGQLPVQLSGPEANTGIYITRFHVPADSTEDATFDEPIYFTGTMTYTTRSGDLRETESRIVPEQYVDKLVSQNEGYFTNNDVVLVEIYYHHRQVLRAPIVEWFFPDDPIILYVRTAMRVSTPSVKE